MKTTFTERKELRKEKRKQKKQKKEMYYKKSYNPEPIQEEKHVVHPLKKKIKKQEKIEIKKAKNDPKLNKKNIEISENDDEVIRKYEKKLGISKDKKKESKFQKEMLRDGLDSDFFSLLDRIHKTTTDPLENYRVPGRIEEEINEEDEEISEESVDFEEEKEEKERVSKKNKKDFKGKNQDFEENDDDFEENEEDNDFEEDSSDKFEENMEDCEGNDGDLEGITEEFKEDDDDNFEEEDTKDKQNIYNISEESSEENELDEDYEANDDDFPDMVEDLEEISEESDQSSVEKIEILHRKPSKTTRSILKTNPTPENEVLKKESKPKKEKEAKKTNENESLRKQSNPKQKPKNEKETNKTNVIEEKTTTKNNAIDAKTIRKTEIIKAEASPELTKKIQSNLNKLAEGNIDNIFSQMMEIFNSNSKFVVNELFTSLFTKNIIENEKNLPHILACTCCFTSGLHQVFDNEFFSELMKKLVVIFFCNFPLLPNASDPTTLPILKNLAHVFCHFYLFDSLPLEFLKEFIELLCSRMGSDTIEVLLLVIQDIGVKVRKDSPKILKELIDMIKASFESFKSENPASDCQKGEFLITILNDIRVNKTIRNNPFETLSFLMSWLKKNVLSKLKLVPKVFSFGLKSMENMDFNKAKWWSLVENTSFPVKNEENNEFSQIVSNERKDYLEKLATEQKFLTTFRKKIFMVVMNAEDYIEAFQNLLKLKLNRKNNQDLAVVLVECCAQEATFNKYYVFLLEKLIEARNELKFSVQYAFWDQFKLLENFPLRRIYNLAKLMSTLIRKHSLGLGSLKGLELDEKNDHVLLFLKAFFRSLLEGELDRREISEMVSKVKRNEENLSFCEALYEYLKRKIYSKMGEEEDIKGKMKSLLGFLKVDM